MLSMFKFQFWYITEDRAVFKYKDATKEKWGCKFLNFPFIEKAKKRLYIYGSTTTNQISW